MKSFPSIPKDIQHVQMYAFDKLDGSNIRCEWNRKKGFHKFGSKTRLIGTDQPFLPEAPDLIKAKFEKEMSDIFRKERYEEATAFFEFYGPSSFAGVHVVEPHDVSLIAVSPFKRGILYPAEYLKLFGDLQIAKLLYRGNPNEEFVRSVKESTLEGMTEEGVVCFAPNGKTPQPIMFKVKSNRWIERLKVYCKGDERLFNELL